MRAVRIAWMRSMSANRDKAEVAHSRLTSSKPDGLKVRETSLKTVSWMIVCFGFDILVRLTCSRENVMKDLSIHVIFLCDQRQ